MKPNWKWKPRMATLFILTLSVSAASPGLALSKETEGLLNQALKDSERELKTLQLARTKERKKTRTARTQPENETATEAR